ncbi:MAG: MBL fold metallo-hydrolase [Chloroflexota bacterium]
MTSPWTEIADRVFVRRYAFVDQNIVTILGDGVALVVDSRTTYPQAREILDDLRALGSPRVGVVVNTHGHWDHAFGNRAFRPAVIWGHERCATMVAMTGDAQRTEAAVHLSAGELADLDEVVLDPPDRVFADRAVVELGGRLVDLAYLGRGHTDNDIVITVRDADILLAGDLLENGATASFSDGYPMDWPVTAQALLELVGSATVVVPGHGDHAGRDFVESQLAGFRAIAALAARVAVGDLDLEAAITLAPYPAPDARAPLERALAQLRDDLAGR